MKNKIQILALVIMLGWLLSNCGGTSGPPPWEVQETDRIKNYDDSSNETSEPSYQAPAQPSQVEKSTLFVVDTISFRPEQTFRYVKDPSESKSTPTRCRISSDNIKIVFQDNLDYFLNLTRESPWINELTPDIRIVSCNMSNDAGKLLRVVIRINDNTNEILSLQVGSRIMSNNAPSIHTSSNDGYHRVVAGDNIKKISAKYGLDVETLLDLNPTVAGRRPKYPVYIGENIKVE